MILQAHEHDTVVLAFALSPSPAPTTHARANLHVIANRWLKRAPILLPK